MLTTDDFCLNNYAFKSSPESCSDRSYSSDFMDVTSDEDFITQLSADLDIPLLLNPGEDELSMLNSFFDKSPEEIMAEITSPPPLKQDEFDLDDLQSVDVTKCGPELFPNLKSEDVSIKNEMSPCSPTSSNKSPSSTPVQVKDEEPAVTAATAIVTPLIINTTSSGGGNVIYQPIQLVGAPKIQKSPTPPKQIPIVPKKPIVVTTAAAQNVLLINKPVITTNTIAKTATTNARANIVILDSNKKIPNTRKTPPIVMDCINRFSLSGGIDPKAFKRQQRKIKNRESASLSRKRKKDYVTSLEEQVKELSAENKRLQQENSQLKDRLSQYEDPPTTASSTPITKAIKPGMFLCAFLLVMGLNLDIKNPFNAKQPDLLPGGTSKLADHHTRNLLWTTEDVDNKTSTNFSPFFMCPAAINQTESARLVLELERWIGKPVDVAFANATLDKNGTKLRQRRRKYKVAADGVVVSSRHRYKSDRRHVAEQPAKNEIQVFSMRPETSYSEFFEAINRQDDTFYVVAFTDQHMLLPALHHNKTRRPKMSLIMPSMLLNDTVSQTSLIPLMQIDCEVLDTRMIHVKHGSIPQHLRTYGNATKKQGTHNDGNDANETKRYKKPYKPYFINNGVKDKYLN